MDFTWNKEDSQEIDQLNERTVSSVLAQIENNATEKEISDYITKHTGQPNDLVIQEVRRVLHKFLSYGFLVKIGNRYRLPCVKDIFSSDGDSPPDGTDEDEEPEGAVGGDANPADGEEFNVALYVNNDAYWIDICNAIDNIEPLIQVNVVTSSTPDTLDTPDDEDDTVSSTTSSDGDDDGEDGI